jgi:hypothetical protein
VRARHLHSKRCLDLIPRRETLNESERSVDTHLANPAARKLSGSLQLVQRGVHKIAGASAKRFFQPIPPNPFRAIGRVELSRLRSDPAASHADGRPTLRDIGHGRPVGVPAHFVLIGFAKDRTSDQLAWITSSHFCQI